MISKFHPAYLTDCLWTSRIGMFFISRTDGWLNAYDLCYKTNEYSFSYKVCDSSITSMSLNIKGDRLVVGDEEGKIYLLKLSKSFYVSNDKTEIESKKNSLLKLLEREVTREKAVETILKKKGNLPKDDSQKQAKLDELIRTKIKKIEEEYFKTVGDILQNQGLRE